MDRVRFFCVFHSCITIENNPGQTINRLLPVRHKFLLPKLPQMNTSLLPLINYIQNIHEEFNSLFKKCVPNPSNILSTE